MPRHEGISRIVNEATMNARLIAKLSVTKKFMPTLLVLLAVVALVGCGNEYPKGWAAVNSEFLARFERHGCPNLSGTYQLDGHRETGGDWLQLEATSVNTRFPYSTITLTGNAGAEIILTYARTPEVMNDYLHKVWNNTPYNARQYNYLVSSERRHSGRFSNLSDEQYEANLVTQGLEGPTHVVKWRYGVEYTCEDGWVEQIVATQEESDNSVVSRSRTRFSKDRDGYLVAYFTRKRDERLGISAEISVPIGRWTYHHWQHWAPGQPAWKGTGR